MNEARENTDPPTIAQVLGSPALLLATWWCTGLSPRAPGTVGSLAALPLCALCLLYLPLWGVLGVAAVLLWVGVWCADTAGKAWGQVDHGAIVIDEVLGQLLALALPFFVLRDVLGQGPNELGLWILGFLLFRLFDITKPWPASYFDRRVKTAWGVMLDDIAAGIWAGVVAIPLLLGLATL